MGLPEREWRMRRIIRILWAGDESAMTHPRTQPSTAKECSLTTPRVSALLARLFSDAEAKDLPFRQSFAALSPEERQRRMAELSHDYQALYGRTAKDLYLAVSPETARLLYMLARTTGARSIVEFGTSFGI